MQARVLAWSRNARTKWIEGDIGKFIQELRQFEQHITEIGAKKVYAELSILMQAAANQWVYMHVVIAKVEQRTEAGIVVEQRTNQKNGEYTSENHPLPR